MFRKIVTHTRVAVMALAFAHALARLAIQPFRPRRSASKARWGGLVPRTSSLILSVFLIVGVAAGAAAKARPSPFFVPQDHFQSRVHKIALRVQPLEDTAYGDTTSTIIAGLLERELTAGGFDVVPHVEFDHRWEARVAESGGVFDPHTGRADSAKVSRTLSLVLDELKSAHQVDAVLTAILFSTQAKLDGASAHWDGVKQRLSPSPLAVLFESGQRGFVSALSLGVVIHDMDRVPLYQNRGGIGLQLREGINGSPPKEVPMNRILSDSVRVLRGIRVALDPVTQRKARR
jgi:hypothetical protein